MGYGFSLDALALKPSDFGIDRVLLGCAVEGVSKPQIVRF
jgi:hypothetical protein